MEFFDVAYRIDFLYPHPPSGLTAEGFELTLTHLFAEHEEAQEAELRAGESRPPVQVVLGAFSFIERHVLTARQHVLTVRHAVRFEGDLPDEPSHAELLGAWLADVLGVIPRQYEGPWNVLEIDVREADDDAPLP